MTSRKISSSVRWQKTEAVCIVSRIKSSSCPTSAKKRCIVREGQFQQLDKACHAWLMQQCSKGARISRRLLQEQLFPKVYPHADANSFKASSGWMAVWFCCRHGIRELSL